MDRHDKANSRFSQFLRTCLKTDFGQQAQRDDETTNHIARTYLFPLSHSNTSGPTQISVHAFHA